MSTSDPGSDSSEGGPVGPDPFVFQDPLLASAATPPHVRPPSLPAESTVESPALTASPLLEPPVMARSLSDDMRTECEDLKEAAEQTLNVIVDLDANGTIRWASPSWEDVIGSSIDQINNQPAHIALGVDQSIFTSATEKMLADDSRSQIIHFPITLGPLSKIAKRRTDAYNQHMAALPEDQRLQDAPTGPDLVLLLEAQGIVVVERGCEEDSHTMWMLRPAKVRKVTLDLPDVVAESLGVGAEILAHYLSRIADAGGAPSDNEIQPPPPVLCRICERQIPPWWFEKHTDLCYQEHKAEMDVQIAHENLNEHRNAIVKVLDALDFQSRPARSLFGPAYDQTTQPLPLAEYKGFRIGPSSTPASNPSSGRASPAISRSRERPSSSFGHQRGRSFAVRRPVVRIVELVVDLCDTALEINTPALKESLNTIDDEPRTQSPQSENRVTQVLQWQSPTAGSGSDHDPGLVMLCADTENFARAKVEAVLRFRRILEYSERIRVEFSLIVQECVENAIRKARQIAAGESSSSSECGSDTNLELENVLTPDEPSSPSVASVIPPSPGRSFDKPAPTPVQLLRQSSMGMTMKNPSDPHSLDSMRCSSSTRSSSPRPPTSHPSQCQNPSTTSTQNKRASLLFESDTGAESDTSIHSFALSQAWRADSPGSELSSAPKLAASRDRKRRSYIFSSVMSSRQQSPSRLTSGQPCSPYRLGKPRNPDAQSPLTSPVLGPGLGDLSSPAPSIQSLSQSLPQMPPHLQHGIHHRRQSSTTSSEIPRPSVSPRLLPVMSNQQPRASPPCIKDFEIIKPISKGAFGSVYLSKKKTTGDYYAIKVLKKADMVAKNQVTNVKAERAIMMWQGESDFVAKLYWTFASKDYLYLVMEYLNGGDLASLIKALGGLPEDWAKKYLAEIVLGVEHLHSRGIVHRDLKPDNLLIDQQGHMKLTDFGLSRMGMLGRQKRALHAKSDEQMPDLLKSGPFHRAASIVQLRTSSFDLHNKSPVQTPNLLPTSSQESNATSYFPLAPSRPDGSGSTLLARTSSIHRSDSEPSESAPSIRSLWPSYEDSLLPPSLQTSQSGRVTGNSLECEPLSIETALADTLPSLTHSSSISRQSTIDSSISLDNTQCSTPSSTNIPPPMPLFDPEDNIHRRFVGTPDYLAPETVSGDAQNELSDWWSVGCILFELLYGYPPFHADSPEAVFQNILARNIHWPDEDEMPVSEEAKELMNRLMCMDPTDRLGANSQELYLSGGAEIKAHPWFEEVNWETVRQDEASFIPNLDHPEDTEYFDARGASIQNFASEFEDQTKPASETPPSEFSRPYDALSRPRTIGPAPKRGSMPLHIPPHVRESRSRRMSETMGGDDFGNFSYKNLPVLEKANKDVIQKLRAEAMQTVVKTPSVVGSPSHVPSAPSLEASPIISNPVKRTLSTNRMMARASSPMPSHVNSSPSRTSQPTSPMLMSSFNSNQACLRKASSCSSSSNSQASTLGSHPGVNQEGARNSPSGHKTTFSTSSSPIRIVTKSQSLPLNAALEKSIPLSRITGLSSECQQVQRANSFVPSSVDSSGKETPLSVSVAKRQTSGGEVSPLSSDSEESRQKALLRVQRRRQSSRRLSHITGFDGPVFRPLDVLVCDDHPVSRWVLEKLLEKLRCRTISVANGSDAVRYATSEVKFDIILMEYKLPQVNGTEVARMIRTTKNSNSHTPLVAVTGYLQDLQSFSHFDSLIEKPPTTQKMIDVLNRHCNWKPAPPNWTPHPTCPPLQPTSSAPATGAGGSSHSFSRYDSIRSGDSPGSSFGGSQPANSVNCGSSRGESADYSLFDPEGRYDDDSSQASRHNSSDSRDRDFLRAFKGLGIHEETDSVSSDHGTDSGRDSFAWKSVASSTDPSGVTTPQSKPSPSSEHHVRKMSDLHSSRRRLLDRSNSCGIPMDDGSVASDEDEESVCVPVIPFRTHPRSANRLRGSSKLGVEMMRTNSRGSIVSVGEPDNQLNTVASPVRRGSGTSTGSASTLSLSADPPDSDMVDTVITRPWPPRFAIPLSSRHQPVDDPWSEQSSPRSGNAVFPMEKFFPPSLPPPPPPMSQPPSVELSPSPNTLPGPERMDNSSSLECTTLAPIQDDSGPDSDSVATPRPAALTPVKDVAVPDTCVPAPDLDSDRTPRPGSRTT